VRLLLLATNFGAPYRVLRCAAALGAEVYVAGAGPARSLALSRYCRRFRLFSFSRHDPEKAAARLDACAREIGADMVLPSDIETTKFLARVKPYLATPVFPLSAPEAIEQLASKDRFMQLCRELNVLQPEGSVVADRRALQEAIEAGRIPLPAILKPLNLAGGMGIVRIDETNAREVAARIDYAPILAQRFIEGVDRCITLFCRDGHVLKQVVYEHPDGVFRFFDDDALAKIAAGIASALNLTGVINFDARIDADGRVWMIECNPRFYFNMDVAMVAGLNIADWTAIALRPPQSIAPQQIRNPTALLCALLRFQKPSRSDLRMLWHWLKDPLIFALVAIGFQERWRFPPISVFGNAGKTRGLVKAQ
jgi:biotin carboxylase